MARRKPKDPETTTSADLPEAEPQAVPENQGLPDYPHCKACGAALVMKDEQAAGVCEACGHLGADGKLYATDAEAAAADESAGDDAEVEGLEGEANEHAEAPAEAAATEPKQPSLYPPEPFDEHAAMVDLRKQARTVEAYRKAYEEKNEVAKSAKKQLDAALLLLEQKGTEYDRKAREWEAEQERQAELLEAYAKEHGVAVDQAPAPTETAEAV